MSYKVSVDGKIGEEKYITTLTAGDNTIISDEPVSFGGQGKGFNPFELLAGSLAACTLATLRSYIAMKKWEVEEILVDVEFESFPKEKEGVFKRYIDFKGEHLTYKQKQRLFDIAEKCPVHNLLQNEITIHSALRSDVTL